MCVCVIFVYCYIILVGQIGGNGAYNKQIMGIFDLKTMYDTRDEKFLIQETKHGQSTWEYELQT